MFLKKYKLNLAAKKNSFWFLFLLILAFPVFASHIKEGGSSASFEIPPGVKNKIELNKPLYESVAKEAGIPWQMLASVHYREANCDPNKSSVSGEDLGTVNADTGQVYTTLEQSLKASAEKLKSLLKAVYGLEINENPNDETLGWSFLSYNRGFMYKNGIGCANDKCTETKPCPGQEGTYYDKSPYVVNFIDKDHRNMHWNGCIDHDFTNADSRPGALTLYKAIGGTSNAPDLCSVITTETGETFNRAALEASLNEMKNLCTKPCYNIEASKVQPYLETFEVTFWNGSSEVKRSVTAHKLVVGSIKAVAEDLRKMKFPVVSFGCFRTGVGGVSKGWSGSPSAHQMGVACDINESYNYGDCKNKNGTTAYSVTPEVANVWKAHGWTVWGACEACYPEGSFKDFCDEMHFSTQDPAVPGILK